ncbi:cysteine/serine endopeptidase inhibitor [Kitasatospora sp. A2-31]|uniref:cysteine/serine endopeptidase inhibitor n=1 Tax=Kitasatospora sp. A2-31 TaxID=2916414 RepID=UPI001EECF30B|nr:cysteine/serine endopeptidase inhibitor [Kitasatospora sp. A2-31]MCG6495484.1 RlpA-like double-psi beta-barrel domain-containing protein [Kitasatospora sp. A2-31]
MRVATNLRILAGAPLAAAALIALTAGSASAAIPINKPMSGKATYYNDAGFGACGTQINAANQMLVAVPHAWWTAANPNNDPLCKGISVKVTYQGKTVTVPVKDKCPSCDSTHIDLSQPAFARLAPLGKGVITGLTWQFVKTGLAGQSIPLSEPVEGATIG